MHVHAEETRTHVHAHTLQQVTVPSLLKEHSFTPTLVLEAACFHWPLSHP